MKNKIKQTKKKTPKKQKKKKLMKGRILIPFFFKIKTVMFCVVEQYSFKTFCHGTQLRGQRPAKGINSSSTGRY